MQLSPGGLPRGRSGQSRPHWLVLGAETSELLYKIQLRLGAQRAGSGSLGTRRCKWGQGEGVVEWGNSSLSDGPAGSAAESKVRQKSLSQRAGAKEQSGQQMRGHVTMRFQSTEGSPVRCPLTSLSACFWPQNVMLP